MGLIQNATLLPDSCVTQNVSLTRTQKTNADAKYETNITLISCALDHQPRYATDVGVERIGTVKFHVMIEEIMSATKGGPKYSDGSPIWQPRYDVHVNSATKTNCMSRLP